MLLPWLILIPFIGGFLCWQTERFGVKMPRWIALITMGLTLALGLQLWLQGGYSLTQSAGIPQWQSEFILPWIPRFGITIHLAIDGLSLLMVVLTGLLGVLAVLCSWREIEKYQVRRVAGGNNSEPWIYKSLAPQRLQNSVPSRA